MNRVNQITLAGTIESAFTFSHECYGEKFYYTYVSVKRKSDTPDRIPVMFSERIIDVHKDYTDRHIIIRGQFRSHTEQCPVKKKLVLFAFATAYEFTDDLQYTNDIYLHGYISGDPVYRTTPLGREITEIILAVKRPCGKIDRIPCIVWGRTAVYLEGFSKGSWIHIYGRIQSREYRKKISDTEYETRTAYEVSVRNVEEMSA